jgi:hypothetical protein
MWSVGMNGHADFQARHWLMVSLVSILALAGPLATFEWARAGEPALIERTDPVRPGGTTTYLDLARHFVPDLAEVDGSERGTRHIAIRHLGGRDFEDPEADDFGISYPSSQIVRADGRTYRAVLFDFNQTGGAAQGFAVLALYDDTDEPVLRDAIEIGFDKITGFQDRPLLPIGKGEDAILTYSTHFNAGQSYLTLAMIKVTNGHFIRIDTLFLFNDMTCAMDRRQAPTFSTAPDGDNRPFAIKVVVTEATTLTGETCDEDETPEASTRTIQATWRWDEKARQHRVDSPAFETLAEENQQRF